MMTDRLSGETLGKPILELGNLYVSDFVTKGESARITKAPLSLCLSDNTHLLQLSQSVDPECMYRNYWYRSGLNESMVRYLHELAEDSKRWVTLNSGDVVLDIASNDGTMLTFYQDNLTRIGIDPSNVARESPTYPNNNIQLANTYFSKDVYQSITDKKPKIVTIVAMFYDLDNPVDFLTDVKELLDDAGIVVIQMSYSPLMVAQNAFDNICHEHVCYYTLHNMAFLADKVGLEIVDCSLNNVNGGSFRVILAKKCTKLTCSDFDRALGRLRTDAYLNYEDKMGYLSDEPYIEFTNRVKNLKIKTMEWLVDCKERGKTVVGYGASTKGNTLLQYYGVTTDLLPCIMERSPQKHGLCTVGTEIPIISEEEGRRMKPDFLFALPWHFITSFVRREKALLEGGTSFVVTLPNLKAYSINSSYDIGST